VRTIDAKDKGGSTMNEYNITDDPATDARTEDAPRAGNHGADVSAVAHAQDPTPETNHGADVSAAAKANHGHSGKLGNQGKGQGHK
jgi:hypothetical protein